MSSDPSTDKASAISQKTQTKRITFQNAAFFVAMIASWGLTGFGLGAALPESLIFPEAGPISNYAIGLVLSAFIQALVGMIWTGVGARAVRRSAAGIVVAALLAPLGLGISGVSGGFSSGSSVFMFEQANLINRARLEAATPAMEAASAVGAASATVRGVLDRIEAHATRQAEIERKRGGSCGVQLGDTCGAICEFRIQQAQQAKDFASVAQSLATDANEITAGAAKADRPSAANEVFKSLLGLKQDPRLDQLRRWIEGQQDGFDAGFTYDRPGHGLTDVTCSDPQFEHLLDDAEDALNTASDIEVSPIPEVKVTAADSVRDNLLLMVRAAMTLVSGEARAKAALIADQKVQQAAPYWSFAALLELACAVLAIASGAAKAPPRRRGGLAGALSEPGDLNDGEKALCEEHLRVIRTYNIRSGEKDYFAAPEEGPDAFACANLAARLELEELPISLVGVHPDETLVDAAVMRRISRCGATSWRLFRDRRGKLRALEKALARRIGFATSSAA